MAIYHLAAQEFSRGAGDSAVHAAAYRARCVLVDERTGLKHDYSRKAGELLFEGIYAPKDAPDWALDRTKLWNHVEAFEKHRRAILAREFVIALPHELTLEQARYAVQDWVRDNFTRKGLIADVTIHAPGADGDERNMHAHVMVVMRKLDGSEFVRTKERFDTYTEKDEARKAELEGLRESWARISNRHLERYGFEPTLDHRTLEAQGIHREPTVHMGKSATAIEREGNPSELGDLNRAINAENERRVIDLAAERAMREARAAARGQVEDIRPQQTARDRSRDFSFRKTAQEAVQAHEPEAASSAPAAATTHTTEAQREAAPASEAPAVIHLGAAVELDRAASTVTGIGSRFLGAIAERFASVIMALADFLAPAPPPTKEQAEGMQRAAEEQQEQTAAAAWGKEQDERLQQILEQTARDDAQRDLSFAQRYGRPPTREANLDHDRDDDSGRERERGYER